MKHHILALALLGLGISTPIAHTGAAQPGTLRFDQITNMQGFNAQSITAVLQDRQGFMWFGTQAGLVKYDGYRNTVYRSDPRDPNSLMDNFVSAAFEDQQGGLWIGTQSGLSFFDKANNRFTNFRRKDTYSGASVNYKVFTILSDGEQGLWLATDYGLMHFDTKTHAFQDYRHEQGDGEGIRTDLLNTIVRDKEGNLWIASPNGLDLMRPPDDKFIHINIDIVGRSRAAQNNVVDLSLGPDQILWIGTDAGLATINLKEKPYIVRPVGENEGFSVARIQTLYRANDGKLWIGTINAGLRMYDPKTGEFTSYRHRPLDPNSLMHNHVSKIFQDRTGALWVGARSSGLSRVDLLSGGFNRYVQFQDDATGDSDNRVRALAIAGQNQLWLGTYAGGLLRLNTKTRQVEVWRKQAGSNKGLIENQIGALWSDKDGKLWVGTRSGLVLFNPDKNEFKPVFVSEEPNDNYIERIIVDRDNTMWISSRGGIHRRRAHESSFKTFRHNANQADSLGNSWSLTLMESSKGVLWIGTMNGLDRYNKDSETFTHYRHDDSQVGTISHNRVHALFEDSKGRLWVGTSGGLNLMEEQADGQVRFRFFPTQSDGSAESIGGILEDSAGNIWISSTAGISKLNVATGQFKNYTARDGMIDGSFLIGATLMTDDGIMNFGGWNGLTSFRPEDIRDNPVPPPVVITDFLISNQSILQSRSNESKQNAIALSELKRITLDHTESIFSIEFAALHYADPSANRFSYKLVGFDDKWVETGANKRFATFTNLDPGTYTFQVKASNKNGIWNEEPTSLEIVITPPFWKTWWFRLSLFLSIAGLTYAVFLYRVRQLLQQKTQLASLVKERTLELEEQKASIQQQKEVLEHAHKNISLLSEIGKDITSTLDTEAIIGLLYRNVNELMDATVFGVGFYDPQRQIIDFPFVTEAGKRYEHYTRDFRQKNQLPVWCIEHQKEIFINDLRNEYQNYIDDLSLTEDPEKWGAVLKDGTSTPNPQSILYVPIFVKGEIRGVVGVQSYKCFAYSNTDLDILRTLASYVGIAVDNADAYEQLKETQNQLVEREKLAALGSLVAGVSHELNTPLGNSLLIASSIEDNIDRISEIIETGPVKRSDFKLFATRCKDACVLLLRSLRTSANLVSSFKQVAVDQASAQARHFNLQQTCNEVVATMMNQVRQAGHQLSIDVPKDIQLYSYPGPLGQVLINLLQNALLHAFDGRQNGEMRLSAEMLNEFEVRLRFHDNGVGIPEENLNRIFEPFFTTKLGYGGSGLGMHITYNIVTQVLEGSIRVDSEVEVGTTVTIDIPVHLHPAIAEGI
ncbi:two-component regulator propeller domain-containing protein [Undibacterium cyanobacteriorum]|uniref:histidine kinase n=1 Tax=Undibacterium cyanobacteriorum TaxID=3073561 RepID=A0ABY9RIR4_9BURK|nr:two-component regulator propeller domain-containing protein [Undibacterium sp. 20NA77.5]WMW80728.1 two-component regulator propeller domain-containing protein [Undibacterium sp. 20NA77.5]